MLPLAAVIASLLRWWVQGSGNMYTATSKRFYVEDPSLGWVEVRTGAVWLGLEVIGVIVGILVGLVVGGFVIRKLEPKRPRLAKILRIAAWIAAVLPLAVPVLAFASGGRPTGAVDLLPTGGSTKSISGLAGSLDAPAGRYEVVPHEEATSITAQLKAGGERFDARFAKDITGTWDGDPRDLTKPMRAEIKAATAAVDTGVSARSNSARDGYLKADQFPHITFTLERVTNAQQDGPKLAFTAKGTLGFVGGKHAVDVTGTLRKADAAALQRLGLTGDVLLAQAHFALVVNDTALASDAGDFDDPTIPIHVSLVLRHTGVSK